MDTEVESYDSYPSDGATEESYIPSESSNEQKRLMIKKVSDGLEQYYNEMNQNPPQYQFEEWWDEHMHSDDNIEANYILEFDENFPLKTKPIDDDHVKELIMEVVHGILNETQNVSISHSIPHCDKNSTDPIKECDSIKRLLSLLEMYSHLDIINNTKHQNLLIEQMNEREEYKEFLNDYIHLLSDHSHQLQIINASLEPCNISECKYTSRHHRREDLEEMKQIQDNIVDKKLEFYMSTIDSLHFYLQHLFDVGLRVKSNTNENEDQSPDAQFSRIYEAVNKGKEVSKSFDRFQDNTKFTISAATGIQID